MVNYAIDTTGFITNVQRPKGQFFTDIEYSFIHLLVDVPPRMIIPSHTCSWP